MSNQANANLGSAKTRELNNTFHVTLQITCNKPPNAEINNEIYIYITFLIAVVSTLV